MTTEKYVTMAAFARHVGVTKVTVLTWKKRGHLVFGPDRKRVDVAKSIERLKARPTKFRGGETKGPRNGADAGPTPDQVVAAPDWSLAESTRRRQAAMARLAEIEVQRAEGKLIEVEVVLRLWARIMLGIRQFVLGLPNTIAFEAPALSAADKARLEQICRDGLEDAALGHGFNLDLAVPCDEAAALREENRHGN